MTVRRLNQQRAKREGVGSVTCDEYLELLSARLDGVLTEAEERALEEHQSGCPDCRAAGAQLAALQSAFDELEDIPVPEGFARGVMDRVRAEEQKVIPLFKRPQFRAIAGLAACAVLVAGLYSTVHLQKKDVAEEGFDRMARGFSQDAQEVLTESSDIPQATAYSDLGVPIEGTEDDVQYEMQKTVSDSSKAYSETYDSIAASPMSSTEILTLERMPEGGWEIIRLEALVSPEGVYVTEELFEEIEQLAAEQGITASITSNAEKAEEFIIVVLEEAE